MTAVLLPLVPAARVPENGIVAVVLNGSPFTVQQGTTLPKEGKVPEKQTCYLTTPVGTLHILLSVDETLQRLGQPAQFAHVLARALAGTPSVTADQIRPGDQDPAE